MTSVPWLGTLRAGEFCTRHRPARGKPKTTIPLTRLRYRRTGVGSPYGDGLAVSTDRRPTPELAPRAVSPTVRLRRLRALVHVVPASTADWRAGRVDGARRVQALGVSLPRFDRVRRSVPLQTVG